jgi:hypothetical protein
MFYDLPFQNTPKRRQQGRIHCEVPSVGAEGGGLLTRRFYDEGDIHRWREEVNYNPPYPHIFNWGNARFGASTGA